MRPTTVGIRGLTTAVTTVWTVRTGLRILVGMSWLWSAPDPADPDDPVAPGHPSPTGAPDGSPSATAPEQAPSAGTASEGPTES